MEDIHALHTAARRFCIDQNTLWVNEYTKLQSEGKAQTKKLLSSTWDYSNSAYSLFPRYRLAQATLTKVEQIVPQQGDSLDKIQKTLEDAGQNALKPLQSEFRENKIALTALDAQAAAFNHLLYGFTPNELQRIEPLPYRRTLSQSEAAAIWEDLKIRWDIPGPGYSWYPLSESGAPEAAIAVHQELWDKRNGNDLFRHFLANNKIERCNVVHEIDLISPDCEIDSSIVTPRYNGSELFITTNDDWVLYASHESSITLVGSLAKYFRSHWPDCEQLSYGGPFHTTDLRGSW
jgi:hypothetical protein